MQRKFILCNYQTAQRHLSIRSTIIALILCCFQRYFPNNQPFVAAEHFSVIAPHYLQSATRSSRDGKTLPGGEGAAEPSHDSYDTTILTVAFNALSRIFDQKDAVSEQHHQQQQHSKRKLIYLPPPPVTPFRGGLKTVHHDPDQTTQNSVNASNIDTASSISAWTPEQYPDPWTNPMACGGAATASLMAEEAKEKQPSNSTDALHLTKDEDFMHWFDIPALIHNGQDSDQGQFLQHRKLLFCDPDQVLDANTLRSVGTKLQAFAETFASSSLIEGGNFGIEEEIIKESSEDSNALPHEGKVTGNRLSALFNSIKAILGTRRKGTAISDGVQEQQLRGVHLLRQDISRGLGVWEEGSIKEPIEVGIALVKKIDLPAILRADSYFFYSDQDDMINDAAQYFARYIHDTWYRHLMMQEQRISSPTNIVLIFISTHDKICYISSGTRIAALLPWWRLEHVVQDMKPDLRKGETGDALGIALDELTEQLQEGPPSFLDRLDDFVERFGVVIAFTVFTFVFATWGECRDRRNRLFSADRRSRMSAAEKEKARQLQKEFKTKMCPICLEPFDSTSKPLDDEKPPHNTKQKQNLKRVDSLGIPLIGSDDRPIKMLRCGHIFDESCWKLWVDSGHGNPWVCPVCRADVGRAKRVVNSSPERVANTETRGRNDGSHRGETEDRRTSFIRVPPATPSMLLLPVGHTHPSYSSIQSLTSFGGSPFAPFSHPPLRRLYPRYASNLNTHHAPTEETSLFEQTYASDENDDDY